MTAIFKPSNATPEAASQFDQFLVATSLMNDFQAHHHGLSQKGLELAIYIAERTRSLDIGHSLQLAVLPSIMSTLSASHCRLGTLTASLAYMNTGVQLAKELVGSLSPTDRNLIPMRLTLAEKEYQKYLMTSSLVDLRTAISTREQVAADLEVFWGDDDLDSDMDSESNNAQGEKIVTSTRDQLDEKLDGTESEEEEDDGIELAVSGATAAYDLQACHMKIGRWYTELYARTGDNKDFEKAFSSIQETLAFLEGDTGPDAFVSSALQKLFFLRFESSQDLDDINRCVGYARDASVDSGLSREGRRLTDGQLASRLRERYVMEGNDNDVNESIMILERLIDDGSDAMPPLLGNLSECYEARYDKRHNNEDGFRAISLGEEAASWPETSPADRAGSLNNVSIYHLSMFNHTGNAFHLDRAIIKGEEAVQTASENDSPDECQYRLNLAAALSIKYEQSRSLDDLKKAIRMSEAALESMPADHSNRALALGNTGDYHSLLYQRSKDLPTLDKAVALCSESVHLSPLPTLGRCRCLYQLTLALSERYEHTKKEQDLQLAIKCGLESFRISETYKFPPHTAGYIDHLGHVLFLKYLSQTSCRVGDLEQAIQLSRKAIEMLEPDHPDRTIFLCNLAARLGDLSLHDDQDGPAIKKEVLKLYLQAWNNTCANPFHRITAAKWAAIELASLGRWQETSALLSEVIELLSHFDPHFGDEEDLATIYAEANDLVSFAGSAAFRAGRCSSSILQTLELGKAAILQSRMGANADTSEFRDRCPALIEEYERLNREINVPRLKLTARSESSGTFVTRRKAAIENLELITTKIRRIEGCEKFLKPLDGKDFQYLAGKGSVVVLTASDNYVDAIVVTEKQISHLNFPDLTWQIVKEKVEEIDASTLHMRRLRSAAERNRNIVSVLGWLWVSIVRPVLDKIGLQKAADEDSECPGLHWIGNGVMGFLPYHAAGLYSLEGAPCVADYVASSYISSFAALAFARQKAFKGLEGTSTTLLAVSTNEGNAPESKLLHVAREIAGVRGATRGYASWHEYVASNAEQTLTEFVNCDILHMACHGVPSEKNPLDSYLKLQHEASNVQSEGDAFDRLTVQAIMASHLLRMQLAFLSACSSAENRVYDLADENLTLAHAFQAAGARHVVATRWPLSDKIMESVAREFYAALVQAHVGGEQDGIVARALHRVTQRARRDGMSALDWAVFVHIGA